MITLEAKGFSGHVQLPEEQSPPTLRSQSLVVSQVTLAPFHVSRTPDALVPVAITTYFRLGGLNSRNYSLQS